MAMRGKIAVCAGVLLGISALAAGAATKHSAEKGPPACAALTFRAVPAGAADGDQRAGFYRSRYGTLALHANVKSGQASDYFVLADGKKLAAAPASLPEWAVGCADRKGMPKPAATASTACTGQQFRVVLAHDDKERLALLYGYDSSAWHYCSAGSY
jgi:hypothetical protein